ncbi:hypothetical protein, partial [Mycolicibacterium conceptionense]|uniref:hypothetical protein n=1 Tax=Mycolicibacterium conceptionense TaxID=451644 RepID=UPI001A967FA1
RSQAHQTTTSHGRHINHSSPRIEAKSIGLGLDDRGNRGTLGGTKVPNARIREISRGAHDFTVPADHGSVSGDAVQGGILGGAFPLSSSWGINVLAMLSEQLLELADRCAPPCG